MSNAFLKKFVSILDDTDLYYLLLEIDDKIRGSKIPNVLTELSLQDKVLCTVVKEPGKTSKEITEILNVRYSSVASALSTLNRAGYIGSTRTGPHKSKRYWVSKHKNRKMKW